MATAEHFLRSSMARLAFTVATGVIAFYMMPFLVTTLGDYWYGVWGVISGVVSQFYFLDLGLTTAVVRFAARSLATQDADATNRVISAAFFVYLLISVGLLLAIVAIAAAAQFVVRDNQHLPYIRLLLLISGAQVALSLPFNAFAGIPSAFLRYDLVSLSRLTMLLLSAALTFTYVAWGYGLLALALIGLICTQVSNGLYYTISKRLFPQLTIRRSFVTRGWVRELFAYSFWSFAIQVVGQLRGRLAPLIIGGLLGPQKVTHYLVGSRLVEYASSLATSATNISMPIFTRYHAEGNYAAMREALLFLTKVHAVLGSLAVGGVLLLAQPFLLRWMGPEYRDSYAVCALLVIAFAPEFLSYPAVNSLYALARHSQLLWIDLGDGALNLLFSLLLVAQFGIIGAALACTIPVLVFRLVVIPHRACTLIELPLGRFYRNLVPAVLFAIGYFGAARLVTAGVFDPPNYARILGAALLVMTSYSLGAFMLILSHRERKWIVSALPPRVTRSFPAVVRWIGVRDS
jgi:O-antigen/teichoic acid export membrane protein